MEKPMSSALSRLLGRLRSTEQSVRESIAELVQEAGSETSMGAAGEAAGLNAQERSLIANVLRLREISADDVMVPRAGYRGDARGCDVGAGDRADAQGGTFKVPGVPRASR